jgi:2-keto-3-deoxy-L-fuconate dehydrogenase
VRIQVLPDPETARRLFSARQPMGRFGTPKEIAEICIYLASDAAGFTTGTAYVIDGGMGL